MSGPGDIAHTINAMETIHINDTPTFMTLPAELRVQILEFIYESPTARTVIDLRQDVPVQSDRPDIDSLELTSKQVRRECVDLRRYQIIAPIFGDSDGSLRSVERHLIAGRLMAMATNAERVARLKKSTIYLGHMGSLKKLRWTEMYSCWSRVLEAIKLLREQVPGLILSLRISIDGGATAQYNFSVKDAKEVSNGMANGRMRDGSLAVLSEAEEEKMQKINKTLVRTIFPVRTDPAPEG